MGAWRGYRGALGCVCGATGVEEFELGMRCREGGKATRGHGGFGAKEENARSVERGAGMGRTWALNASDSSCRRASFSAASPSMQASCRWLSRSSSSRSKASWTSFCSRTARGI